MLNIRVSSYEGKRYITRYTTAKVQRLGVYRPRKVK